MFTKILKIAEAQKQIDALSEQVAAYDYQVTQLETDLQGAKDLAGDFQGQMAEKDIELSVLAEELDNASAEIKSLKDNSVNATKEAADIIASVGIPEPIPTEDKSEGNSEGLMEQFMALEDPLERQEFYKANRNKLINLQ